MQLRARRFAYQLVDPTFFEPFDRYQPNAAHYVNFVHAYLPDGWRTGRKGVWAFCHPPQDALPTQGWKIHLSATLYNARAVLASAVPVLVSRSVPFKFAADRRIFGLMSGKNWARGGSGKFMTVYPRDDAEFRVLVELLHNETKGLAGPYILSDARYKDGIVYYRYGTIRPVESLDKDGRRVTHLVGPNGERQVDERNPVFTVPSWTTDPFPRDDSADDGESNTLKNGRYHIDSVLSYTNSGGVYLATDRETGAEVVIKEARPFVGGASAETDAIALLQKEYRVMKAVEDTGYAPVAYDLFRDWEHWFLVEERIDGETLFKMGSKHMILLNTRPTEEDYRRYHQRFRDVFGELARAVAAFHERGIALCDLSPNNVLVSPDGKRIRLIDFEGACRNGVDIPMDLMTPGFAPRTLSEAPSQNRFADDYYALAAMMFSFAFPAAQFMQLKRADVLPVLDEILRDARIPEDVAALIRLGMTGDEAERPAPQRVAEVIERASWDATPPESSEPYPVDTATIARRAESLTSFILGHATPDRPDKLFPGDFRMFETNPLSLGYGAYGTLFALKRAAAEIPAGHLEWIRKHPATNDVMTPGFLIGQAGLAWTMMEFGELERAAELLRSARLHPLLHDAHSLYEGRAGWILAAFRLYLETRDEQWFDAALAEADLLIERAVADEAGRLAWPHTDEHVHLGLGYGASGIALVLLYATLLSGERKYADAGLRALRFDIAHAQPMGENESRGLSWAYVVDDTSIQLPYTMYGSAGIGSVLLRYRHLAGAAEFDDVLEKIYLDTDRKYSVGLGRLMGLAGIANFRLDAHAFTGEQRHLDTVGKLLRGIELFRIDRENGATYPTELLDRLACDYGYGCAGILSTFARILDRTGDELMLDRYISAPRQALVRAA